VTTTPGAMRPLQARPHRVGFVSTRFAGTDGVSLETGKWASIFERLGHTCFYFAGECDRPAERSRVVPEAFYRHPDIQAINDLAYPTGSGANGAGGMTHAALHGSTGAAGAAMRDGEPWPWRWPNARPPLLTERIHELREALKAELRAFLAQFDIDLLIIENASAIPLNLPLGLAISELVAETGIPTLAHHHDFHWERQRFLVNCVPDILASAFPPAHASIHHVVINSVQARELASRHGLTARVIPNVMEFEVPPRPPAAPPSEVRTELGIAAGELLILQPTRVIPRKGIEHAIEFTRRLGRSARLVVSHASGDEGPEYERRLRAYADLLGVDVRFEGEIIGDVPGTTPDGRQILTLADVYPAADFVTYPSAFEGFGNAFLEAIYHRRSILVNNYSTYEVDIRPRGFRVVGLDGFVSEQAMDLARRLLDDPALAAQWAARNYELAARHFSFTVLRRHLEDLLLDCFGVDVDGR
jgi:mannosylglucosylglycerate synthase